MSFWAKNLALNKPRTSDFAFFQATGINNKITDIRSSLVSFSSAGNRGTYFIIDWGTGNIFHHLNTGATFFQPAIDMSQNIYRIKVKPSIGIMSITSISAPSNNPRWTGEFHFPIIDTIGTNGGVIIIQNNITGVTYGSGTIGVGSNFEFRQNKISDFPFQLNLSGVATMNLSTNLLKSINLPNSMGRVTNLTLNDNSITGNLTLPEFAPRLTTLNISSMNLDESRFSFPTGVTTVQSLTMSTNNFSGVYMPETWTGLIAFTFNAAAKLTGLTFPSNCPMLNFISAASSQLKTVVLPSNASGMQTVGFIISKMTGIVIPSTYTGIKIFNIQSVNNSSTDYCSGLVFQNGFNLYKDTSFVMDTARITGFDRFPPSFTGGTNNQLQTNFLTGFSLPTGGTIWNLSGNVLNDITNIENNPNFRFLYLSGNKLGQNQLDYVLGATWSGSTNFGIVRSGIVDIRYNLGTLSASGLAYSGLLSGSGWSIWA